MNRKNDVEVIINKKRYVLCGYESDEYMQKIASYLNGKHQELREQPFFNGLESDMKTVLLNINLADDYFKALSQIKEMEQENHQSRDELFELKHELIQLQSKYDNLTKDYECLQTDYQESQKSIVRLETELETSKQEE